MGDEFVIVDMAYADICITVYLEDMPFDEQLNKHGENNFNKAMIEEAVERVKKHGISIPDAGVRYHVEVSDV